MSTSTPPFTRPFDALDAAIARTAEALRDSTADRERDRVLLHGPVRELVEAGFGTLRVPTGAGGLGGSLEDLFERLVHLAAADPNLAHVFRGHIGFVESLHVEGDRERAAAWLERAASGVLVGNAQSERASTADLSATVERTPEGLRLTGAKYYTTGSIYSDWILLSARLDEDTVNVLVDASHPGVVSVDDWDGFGQPLTGSGTTTFDAVPVDPADVLPWDERDGGAGEYVAAVFQLTLLAVIAGIGEAARAETVAFVQPRRRIFGFAGEARPRDDALVQQVVGQVSSAVDAARRIVLSAARDLDRARADAATTESLAPRQLVFREAVLAVYRAQQIVPKLVLDAATQLFEVGGASAVGTSHALDRHWRNARTLASHNPALQRARAIGEYELNGTFATWGRTHTPVSSAPDSPAPAAIDSSLIPASTGVSV